MKRMSSPLSSLKKPQKTPLMGFNQGHRPVPFRNPQYTDDESKLLEEITGTMASQRIKTRDPFLGGLPKLPNVSPRASQGFGMPQKGHAAPDLPRSNSDLGQLALISPPSDHELMATMISRITQLEARLAVQAQEMADKEKKIQVLTEKNKLLQKAQGSNDPNSRVVELENKCYQLQEQIQQMENFLSDYGMVWVGEDEEQAEQEESDEEEMWRPGSSVSQQPTFRVDYNRLVENIKDLNALAGEGVAFITQTKDGARLKMPDSIQLTLYANGILMFNGPFRPFTDPTTQVCVQDILDGYFPSELQGRYPDGVPFNVTDKREVHYQERQHEIFKGAGQTLGGETVPSRLVPSNIQDRNPRSSQSKDKPVQATTSELPGPQLTVEQFLQKLPKSVMKAGKIIDIRSSLGDTLNGGKPSQPEVTLVETDTVIAMRKRLAGEAELSRPCTPRDITTLRIKSEDGGHTYILKMKFSETVGSLRKYLQAQRSNSVAAFDIVSTHPTKVHTDDSLTLQEAGLTPNAVAYLKKKS
ncbi:UBX domain-containing protein 11-like isoform X3 [Dreissena polymorpha]|uniref:UBX domain-containing protein 11-like isoform X3 n=1 Tax=Dreissena polymorpha TaxID=45954 RepID=UPI002263F4D9|nr:UBX domain-containing protein 11-like isoform X3 [Dreissena polymorpha]